MIGFLAIVSLLCPLAGSPANGGKEVPVRSSGDMIITSTNQFRGLMVGTRSGETTQVLDLVYGLDESLALFPAYLRVMTEDGRIVERDARNRAMTIFSSPEQIRGCYLTINGRKTWVEGVQLGTNRSDNLCILGTRTLDESGQLIDTFVAPQKGAVVCASQGNWVCGTSSCSGGAACPDSGAPACPCPSGTQSCAPAQEWECRPGSWCPTGQVCRLDTSTNECHCEQ